MFSQNRWPLDPFSCHVYGFVGFVLGLGSIWALLLLALDRYLFLCNDSYGLNK